MTDEARGEIIATWENLDYVISEQWRGRKTEREVKDAHAKYRAACEAAGEGWFVRRDINNDDMEHIPPGYPYDGPADFPLRKGYYDTPSAQARRERLDKLIGAAGGTEALLMRMRERSSVIERVKTQLDKDPGFKAELVKWLESN